MSGQQDSAGNRGPWLYAVVFSLVALSYVLLANAWVVDDAYITFRTVDNFVNGFGLRWNVDERVQVYTHPLWMLVMSAVYFVSHEAFFSSIVVSFLLSLGSVVICSRFLTRGFRNDLWKVPLLVLAVVASKSVVDYASSGLENALSYLIVAVFAVDLLRAKDKDRAPLAQLQRSLFLASLGFLNRPDLVLLFLPALVYRFVRALGTTTAPRLIAGVLISTSPATLWTLFSLVYYGFPFPNTAYAKAISTGFPAAWKLQRGLDYTVDSLRNDAIGHLMLVAACVLALRMKAKKAMLFLGGMVLYAGYVVASGAAATHMGGRFYAVVLFGAIFMFVLLLENRRLAAVTAGVLAVYVVWSPVSAVKYGTSAYRMRAQNFSTIDAKGYVFKEGAALINWRPGKHMPDHDWYRYGEQVARSPGRLHGGGTGQGQEAIGYMGFAAGPRKHIIDRVALGDAFLSKLPAVRPPQYEQWKSGHFHRLFPEGYAETLASGVDQFGDADLGRYYAIVRNITTGPVFRGDRFKDIWNINLGRYDDLTENYSEWMREAVRQQLQGAS